MVLTEFRAHSSPFSPRGTRPLVEIEGSDGYRAHLTPNEADSLAEQLKTAAAQARQEETRDG